MRLDGGPDGGVDPEVHAVPLPQVVDRREHLADLGAERTQCQRTPPGATHGQEEGAPPRACRDSDLNRHPERLNPHLET